MHTRAHRHAEQGMTVRREIAGFSLKEFSQPAGCRLPRHEHEHPSICFVVSGSYAERARGREQECRPQSMVFKPAAEPHANVFGRAGGRCLLIEILPEGARASQLAPVTAEPRLARSSRLAALGGRLHGELFERDDAAPLAIEGLILELLADASRTLVRERSPAEPRWLRRTREMLHDHRGGSLTLSAVAATIGIDPSHLARTFRGRYGCTVGEYVRRLRIERAMAELATTRAPLAEVALRAGFCDQSHFSRVFRRQTGTTPGEYRARLTATCG